MLSVLLIKKHRDELAEINIIECTSLAVVIYNRRDMPILQTMCTLRKPVFKEENFLYFYPTAIQNFSEQIETFEGVIPAIYYERMCENWKNMRSFEGRQNMNRLLLEMLSSREVRFTLFSNQRASRTTEVDDRLANI